MKTILTGFIFGLLTLGACNNPQPKSDAAQEESQTEMAADEENSSEEDSKSERPSPPRKVTGAVGDMSVEISYSSPKVKGRTIWGGLVPYGEVWRTGANEATTISFSKTALVEGKKLAAGKYSLFTIPGEEKWTVIFNAVAEQWGAYEYDKAKDALRVEVTPRPIDEHVESMEFIVADGKVALRWEKLEVAFGVAAAE
ncbi:MAG: DUF2911 domain-containing protein [Phaeodactylibacter sp.]|nr:DUF2911 domain-containing protein [Phaeodactylibacter sp.]